MEVFGKPKFKDGLEKLGYEVEDFENDQLAIRYKISKGRFKDKEIKVGFVVPTDFEVTPPSGPHISLRLLPLNPSGADHKTRAHESPFGSDWEYLSRPVQHIWQRDRTVKRYMQYVTHLLNTL